VKHEPESPYYEGEFQISDKEDRNTFKAVVLQRAVSSENIWLPQKRIAELFDVDRSVVTRHLKNIFSENELQEDSVCANYAHTATKQFFAAVQNKLHFAITRQTAAEVIATRARSDKPNMGLTSWRKATGGKIMPLQFVPLIHCYLTTYNFLYLSYHKPELRY
jgi:hypothetical protein